MRASTGSSMQTLSDSSVFRTCAPGWPHAQRGGQVRLRGEDGLSPPHHRGSKKGVFEPLRPQIVAGMLVNGIVESGKALLWEGQEARQDDEGRSSEPVEETC